MAEINEILESALQFLIHARISPNKEEIKKEEPKKEEPKKEEPKKEEPKKEESKKETESKAETKAEKKVEQKTEVKAEVKVEAKVEAKVETKVETKVEAKVEAKAEAIVEQKTEAKVETKAEAKVEAKAETAKVETAKVETKAEPATTQTPFEILELQLSQTPSIRSSISSNPKFDEILQEFSNQSQKNAISRIVCSFLTTLCKGDLEVKRNLLQNRPYLIEKLKVLSESVDRALALVSSLCWEEKNRDLFVSNNFIPLLIKLLNPSHGVKPNAFSASAIGGLCVGSSLRVQEVVRAGAIPNLVQLLSSSQEKEFPCKSALQALSLLAIHENISTQIMLHGGTQRMLSVLIDVDENDVEKVPLIRNVLSCLCSMAYTSTVRDLIWTLLLQHPHAIKKLVVHTKSPDFDISFHSVSIICLLLLNEHNINLFREHEGIEAVRYFCQHKNPLEENAKFLFDNHELKKFQLLISSTFLEQKMFFFFICARFSSKNPTVNRKHVECLQFFYENIDAINYFSFHSNPTIQLLASTTLKHLNYGPYQRLADTKSWLNTLSLNQEQQNLALTSLSNEVLTTQVLLDQSVESDLIKNSILSLNLPQGIKLSLWSSINQLRLQLTESFELFESNNSSKNLSNNNSSKISRKEKSFVDDETNTITSAFDQSDQTPECFISYSWNDKKTCQKLRNVLEKNHVLCWMDERKMSGGDALFESIDSGISGCEVFIACISDSYASSQNCTREILLAADRKKLIIPVLVGPLVTFPPRGSCGPLLAGKLYINMSTQALFEDCEENFVDAIKKSLTI